MTLVTAKAITQQFNISQDVIDKEISKGRMPHHYLNGELRFNPIEIEAWIESQQRDINEWVYKQNVKDAVQDVRDKFNILEERIGEI